MSKRYDQYCPVAHALSLVGERWALLVVLELLHGPKRYTDLAENLPGIGTNILACRLRDLEACGVVAKRTLPPPTPARVYELTEYGRGLKPAIRELALWGARSLGPPTTEDDLFPGWLENALDTVLAPVAPPGRFEFRVGDEVASLIDGEAIPGSIEDPDVVDEGDPEGVYHLLVDRSLDLRGCDAGPNVAQRILSVADRAAETLNPGCDARVLARLRSDQQRDLALTLRARLCKQGSLLFRQLGFGRRSAGADGKQQTGQQAQADHAEKSACGACQNPALPGSDMSERAPVCTPLLRP